MTMTSRPVETTRMSPDSQTVHANLGLLQDLAGTWQGQGFNLIARPDFKENANLYLQLNQTRETLEIQPIGSAIPNRGFGQGDISLFGLTYLDKIIDVYTGGALHIEPGIWITQPSTQYPEKQLTFLTQPNQPKGPTVTVNTPDRAGGIENILFLEGGEPQGAKGPNAQTAQVYATFWIEKVRPAGGMPFMQLQYAQMTVLNFPILKVLPNVVNLGWPHISVATLRKAFL